MEVPYRGSGVIYFKDKEYRCDLYYSEKLGGIVLRINIKDKKGLGDFLELPFEIPFICGKLDSGFMFTLLVLNRTNMESLISYGTTVYTFEAKYILCGTGKDKVLEQTFNRIQYVLSDIVEWGGESIYNIGEKFELYSVEEESRQILYECEKFKITYSVSGSILPISKNDLLHEEIVLNQSGVIEISFNSEEPLARFNNIFNGVKALIEICIRNKLNLEKVYGFSQGITYELGDRKIERAIEIYGEEIQEKEFVKPSRNRSWKWITLSELLKYNSFEKYFSKNKKLEPIVELILESHYVGQCSTTRLFLNIVQALETYHSRFVSNNIKDFKSRVNLLLKGFNDEQKLTHKNYLIANSKRFITLESRLADLLLAEWHFYFDTGEIKHDEFPKIIAQTRNYYIHYDESIKENCKILNEEELQLYNRVLMQILEYYILVELGYVVESKELNEKLRERWGNVSQDLSVIKASKDKHSI